MSPTPRKAARSRLRKTAHATTKAINSLGEGVPNLQLTEAQWQARVIGLARFYGWRVYHPPDNVRAVQVRALERALHASPGMSGAQLVARARQLAKVQDVAAGFPDLTLTREDDCPELLFAELKAEKGRLGPGQAEWGDALDRVGQAVAEQVSHVYADVAGPEPLVEHHIWRPSMEDAVHDRLARGRVRIEPSWFVGELYGDEIQGLHQIITEGTASGGQAIPDPCCPNWTPDDGCPLHG